MTDNRYEIMTLYQRSDPKQSFDSFLAESVALFHRRHGRLPNRGLVHPSVEIQNLSMMLSIEKKHYVLKEHLFLWTSNHD